MPKTLSHKDDGRKKEKYLIDFSDAVDILHWYDTKTQSVVAD